MFAPHDSIVEIQVPPVLPGAVAQHAEPVSLKVHAFPGDDIHRIVWKFGRDVKHRDRRIGLPQCGGLADDLFPPDDIGEVEKCEVLRVFVDGIPDLIVCRVLQDIPAAAVLAAGEFIIGEDQVERHIEHFLHRPSGNFEMVQVDPVMPGHLGKMDHAAQRHEVIAGPFRPEPAFGSGRAELPVKSVLPLQRKVDQFPVIIQKTDRGRDVVVPELPVGGRFRELLGDLRKRVEKVVLQLCPVILRKPFVIVEEVIAVRHVGPPERFGQRTEEDVRRSENGVGGGVLQVEVGELHEDFFPGARIPLVIVHVVQDPHPDQPGGEQAVIPSRPCHVVLAAAEDFRGVLTAPMLGRPEFFIQELHIMVGTTVHLVLVHLFDGGDEDRSLLDEPVDIPLMGFHDAPIPTVFLGPLSCSFDVGLVRDETRMGALSQCRSGKGQEKKSQRGSANRFVHGNPFLINVEIQATAGPLVSPLHPRAHAGGFSLPQTL